METQFKVSIESTIYKKPFIYTYSNIDDAVNKYKAEVLEHANMGNLFDMITIIELKRLAIYNMPDTVLKQITVNSLVQMGA